MKRDVYTFLSGLFAGFAIEHAVIAIYLSAGVFDLPEIMGRQWPDWSPWLAAASTRPSASGWVTSPGAGRGRRSVKFAWAEVAIYSAVSLALAYRGWRADSRPGIHPEPRRDRRG